MAHAQELFARQVAHVYELHVKAGGDAKLDTAGGSTGNTIASRIWLTAPNVRPTICAAWSRGPRSLQS